MKKKSCGDKYPNIEAILTDFLCYGSEQDEPWDDIDIIKHFIDISDKEDCTQFMQEISLILKEDPFPDGWVGFVSNWGPDEGTYKQWIEGIGKTFEIEAKKAGKL